MWRRGVSEGDGLQWATVRRGRELLGLDQIEAALSNCAAIEYTTTTDFSNAWWL